MYGIALFDLILFVLGAFVAAFVNGVAGFAFGLMAAAIWLYALPPSQTTVLIVAYGLLVGSYNVWKLRHNLNIGRLLPLIVGSAIGVPFGILALRWMPSSYLRSTIGAVLILFSLYNLLRPNLPSMKQAGRLGDASAGFLNGVVGGATGLAGIIVVIWSSLRGWQRDEQRAVVSPTSIATFLITLIALGRVGSITTEVIKLFALGLPALAAGTWIGWIVYGRLDEGRFRKGVLILLLASGVVLAI
jgi:uncharacterized membrane protein YfcA